VLFVVNSKFLEQIWQTVQSLAVVAQLSTKGSRNAS
jgi:hypothetical protein